MANPLYDRRTAAELASARQVIEIAEKIDSFDDLVEVLEADLSALEPDVRPSKWRDSTICGELSFDFADSDCRIPTVSGSATARVDAVCQRCLEPCRLRLTIEPELVLLGADETVDGYDGYEVWELDEPTFRPIDIVDELLVMAMPFAAAHDNMAECKALSPDAVTSSVESEKRVKPFAALREQMTRHLDDSDE